MNTYNQAYNTPSRITQFQIREGQYTSSSVRSEGLKGNTYLVKLIKSLLQTKMIQ